MSAQELADLESLYADGVLDEDEYKTKLAELTPKKERTRADELADLERRRQLVPSWLAGPNRWLFRAPWWPHRHG